MLGTKNHVNYYEVLEVAYDAPQHEVHKAYTRAKATYAQDNPALYSMFTRDEARDLLKLIEEAYSVLGNHGLRRNYDDTLQKSSPARAALSSVPRQAAPSAGFVQDTHDALPDFMVPDPSIPGSFDESEPIPTYSRPIEVNTLIEPPRSNSTDPAPATAAGKRESILVTNSDFTVRKLESDIPLMPPDTGKCPLGTYKIDAAIEAEIAARTEFDGPFLQRVRVYKQVSLEKLSVASRIGKTYLIALESNDFKNLPAPVFLRGFLVQMGRQLGIDEQKVVTSYMSLAKASEKYASKYGS